MRARPAYRRYFFCGFAAALVGLCAVHADEASSKYVILKNGQTLQGSVVVLGDRYQITLQNGSDLRIDSARVDCVVACLADAYEHKFQRVEPRSFRARATLAEWCLHHRLQSQAATEIAAAKLIEPSNPRIAGLERRLQSLSDSSLQRTAIDAGKPERTAEKPAVRQANFDEELPEKETANSLRRPASTRSPAVKDRSEQLAAELPARAVEEFTQIVQPFMLNRCATNNCHGTNDLPTFHLIRPPPGKTLSRRLTLQNLNAMLPSVDRTNPDASPLLQVPLAPHGPVRGALLSTDGDKAYSKLKHWVGLFATRGDTEQADEPASIPVPDKERFATKPDSEPAAAPATAFRPKDAFDPELFNRRYGKQ